MAEFVIVGGRTAKQTHVALGFKRDIPVQKYKYEYNPETKKYEHPASTSISDYVYTACGFFIATTGKRFKANLPTCGYCSGYVSNMMAMEGNALVLSPEEYIASKA